MRVSLPTQLSGTLPSTGGGGLVDCAATGAVEIQPGARRGDRGEVVFESDTSLFFKETRVHRFIDEERNTVVYLAWSTRLIDGSPYNAVAVVPVR